ncbi:MAG: phosphoribosylformylglycinamidine synthase subunit PurQ [Candidatus Tectomicrobia bacterium]|uniref:Phosphoribosylformylglycinamidine synthase subunit PurQ n=1 Tax=Tectimicrobiota bacterium TaxID=2528274 RepID=A0A932I324_UNCTE|nr:phosphoribosylformylglycinamidine synthase subunit PurQ [Candidatus Tectomicrobia bacterium]
MRFAVLVFPGSNCDHDSYHAVKHVLGADAHFVWHKEGGLGGADVVIVPGGFSYGDYLRAGAIARFSPVMEAVRRHAAQGRPVLGTCNGFQILTEAGLLPGALRRNASLRFICDDVWLRCETSRTPFTQAIDAGERLKMPIAHGEGSFFCAPETLAEMEVHGQVVFRYCDAEGGLTPEANPNGSTAHIAGVCNRAGNVLGLMPHPERASEPDMGSEDGLRLFQSVLSVVTA